MKKITSFLALFLMFLGVSLQASADALPQLTEDPANPKWYYVQSYRSGKYLGHDANGNVLQVADFNEASLWYFLKSGDAVLLCNGSEGNLQFTASDSQTLTANGTPMYIVQHEFNDCGLSICKNPTIQGGDCIDANNNNDNIGWWAPNAGDNQGTTWRIKSLTDIAQDIESGVDSKLMGTYADTPEVRAALEDAKVNSNDPAAFIKFVNETMPTLAMKMPVKGKTYIVKSCYEEYFKKQGVEKALCDDTTKPMWNTLDRANKSFYWNIVPATEGYTFQNLASNKYIKALGEVADAADAAATIKMEAVGGNKWKLTLNGEAFHTNSHKSGSGVSGNIVNWYADPLGACQWYVEEAEFTEPTDVVYDYYVGSEKVYSQIASQMIGTDFVLPYSNEYFDATIETAGTVHKGSVVKVICVEKNVPFVATTDTKNPTWYIVDIHGQTRYWNATAEAGKIKTPEVKNEVALTELSKDDYQWCFVGNAVAGYKIYNKVKGFGEALTNAETYVNFAPAAEAIVWKLVKSTAFEGAVCFSDGKNNINHQEVEDNGGTLMYWNAADAGSSCRIYTLAQLEDKILTENGEALLAKADALFPTYVGSVGSYTYFQNVDQFNTLVDAFNSLAEDKTNLDKQDVLRAEMHKVLATEQVPFVAGQVYRIMNYARNLSVDNENHPGEGGYMSTTPFVAKAQKGTAPVTCTTNQLDDAGALWVVEQEGENVMLKNLNTGKYVGVTNTEKKSQYLQMVEKEAAGAYAMQEKEHAQFVFACNVDKEGTHNELHVSGYGVMNYNGGANSASAWCLFPANSLEVNMNRVEGAAESWASLYLPFGVQLNGGVEAYAGKVNGDVVNLTSVGAELPANTPVVLKGTESKYTLTLANVAGSVADNDFQGSVTEKSLVDPLPEGAAEGTEPTRHNVEYYVLGNGEAGVGMYNPAGDVLKVNKVYLDASKVPAAVNGLKFVFGEATGVEGVEVETENAVYYDLSGRRVANPVKGIYVVNGKKVLVK